MDVEKLIERLRTESLYKDKATLEIMDLCMEAAEALTTLQAELEKVKAEKERFKEYAIDADNTMDSLYGACGKFCDDTILAFWDEWRGRKEE